MMHTLDHATLRSTSILPPNGSPNSATIPRTITRREATMPVEVAVALKEIVDNDQIEYVFICQL